MSAELGLPPAIVEGEMLKNRRVVGLMEQLEKLPRINHQRGGARPSNTEE